MEPTAMDADIEFPTCDEVKAALGSALDGLIEDDSTENGLVTGSESPELAAAGAWALKIGGDYDAGDQSDALGVQVVRTTRRAGVALQDVPQLATLTDEWALGAGVVVLGLME